MLSQSPSAAPSRVRVQFKSKTIRRRLEKSIEESLKPNSGLSMRDLANL
jgi:hypothetical protein